jgi:hypothetical protein
MMGEYFHEKKKKRDRITATLVANISTPLLGLYYTEGPFIAEAIWACNGDTTCHTFQILDGTVPLTCDIVIAPSCTCCLADSDDYRAMKVVQNFYDFNGLTWMPFFTAVNILATSALVVVTMGGWIP